MAVSWISARVASQAKKRKHIALDTARAGYTTSKQSHKHTAFDIARARYTTSKQSHKHTAFDTVVLKLYHSGVAVYPEPNETPTK